MLIRTGLISYIQTADTEQLSIILSIIKREEQEPTVKSVSFVGKTNERAKRAERSMGILDYHYPTAVTREPRDNYKINEPSMNQFGDRGGYTYIILGRKSANGRTVEVGGGKTTQQSARRNLPSPDGHVPPFFPALYWLLPQFVEGY